MGGGYISDEVVEDEGTEDFFEEDGYRNSGKPSFLTSLYDAVGPTAFLIIFAVALAWIPADLWLSSTLHWPESYGWRCVSGSNCWIGDMWHSLLLLRHHTPRELALFVCIWMIPAALSGIALVRLRKARRPKPLSNSEAE